MADSFDPDKYLAEKRASSSGAGRGFDPDRYLAEKTGRPIDKTIVGSGSSGALPPWATAITSFGDMAGSGLENKILAGEEALWDKFSDKTGKVTLSDAYQRNLRQIDPLLKESDKANTKARYAGDAAGLAASVFGPSIARGGVQALRSAGLVGTLGGLLDSGAETAATPAITRGQQLLRAMGQGLKGGSAYGAVAGYGGDRSDSALGTLGHVGEGMAGGGVLGALAPPLIAGGARAVGAGGRLGSSMLEKFMPAPEILSEERVPEAIARENLPLLIQQARPSEDAKTLQRLAGAPLTIGQMHPDSALSEAETSALRVPILGGKIAAQRKAAEDVTKQAVMGMAAPTEGPFPSTDLNKMLDDVHRRFSAAYGPIRETPVQALGTTAEGGLAPLDEVFSKAAFDKGVGANHEERTRALNWLTNLATTEQLGLGDVSMTRSPRLVKAGDVLDVRSAIRTEAREAMQAGDRNYSKLLKSAEGSLTGGLENQLPDFQRSALKDIDQKYSKYKILEDALYKANDQPGGFTWNQFSNAIRAATPKSVYARGGGGDLRDIAEASRNVFKEPPRTGFGEKFSAPFGLASFPSVYAANSSPGGFQALLQAAQSNTPIRSQAPEKYGSTLLDLMRLSAAPAGTLGGMVGR